MSDLPPPPLVPLPYYTAQYTGSRRPLSVSVIGWCAAIWGTIGVAGGACTVIQHEFLSKLMQTPANPYTDVLYSHGVIGIYSIVAQVLGFFVSLLLLVAGVGCLNLNPRTPRLLIGLMIFQLFLLLVGVVFSLAFLLPAFAKTAAQHPADPSVQSQYTFMVVAQIFSFVIGLAIPLVVLFFVTRPRFKAAFAAPLPLPTSPPLA